MQSEHGRSELLTGLTMALGGRLLLHEIASEMITIREGVTTGNELGIPGILQGARKNSRQYDVLK